jgi:hypothetical protein
MTTPDMLYLGLVLAAFFVFGCALAFITFSPAGKSGE